MSNVIKKFWQSSNFWTWLVLGAGSLIVGFGEVESDAVNLVSLVFAVFAGGKILHNFFKKGIKFDKSQMGSSNFWGYIALIASSIFTVAIPDQLFEDFQTITEALQNGNWTGAIGAVLSAIVIIANLVKNKPTVPR